MSSKYEGIIAKGVELLIKAIYRVSPYCWIDEYYKKREPSVDSDPTGWRKVRHLRYCISECYILVWLVLGVLATFFAGYLSIWVVLLFLLRALGILNKELGVLLFGTCKITEGRGISTPQRIVILALINYVTFAFLFAFAYQRVGSSVLPMGQALIQALSVSLTFGPAFVPTENDQWFIVLFQGATCFLFLGLVISQFVSLLHLEAVSTLVEKENKGNCPGSSPGGDNESKKEAGTGDLACAEATGTRVQEWTHFDHVTGPSIGGALIVTILGIALWVGPCTRHELGRHNTGAAPDANRTSVRLSPVSF